MSRAIRIGLVASRLHREGPDAALIKLIAPLEATLRERLRPQLVVVGQTYDALLHAALLPGYPDITRLPSRRSGGLIHLVAHVVSDDPTHNGKRHTPAPTGT